MCKFVKFFEIPGRKAFCPGGLRQFSGPEQGFDPLSVGLEGGPGGGGGGKHFPPCGKAAFHQPDKGLPFRGSIGLGGQPDDGAVSTGELLQEEFSLTSYSRGIFENLPPTKYRDEDLDIPTFQRRNISIDRGKTGA